MKQPPLKWFLIVCCDTWLPLWSSGQSSWLQIQRSRFDSRHYQIFWEVVDLEWGQLSLVSTNEELLWRESSSSSLEIQEYGHRDLSCWPHGTLYPQKMALTLLTSGSRLVSIVRSWTKPTEFVSFVCFCNAVIHHINKHFNTNRDANVINNHVPYLMTYNLLEIL
jgi:hypothetical protein